MNKTEFKHLLLSWYETKKRDLPWRKTNEPYPIWVSEIMLQQTRVKAVQPFFDKFMQRFPTVESLAEAKQQELLKYWQGLGFYRRAVNMQRTAKIICKEFQGQFPVDYETLLQFPGIGEYTAAAISSFSRGQKKAVLDGNVMRVVARLFSVSDNIMKTSTKKKLANHLASVFPDSCCGNFNQAMMELGSLICLPKNPKCAECPLSKFCQAFAKNLQTAIPKRDKKTKVKTVKRYHLICQYENQFLLNKRPATGLLANFWEFPGMEAANLKEVQRQFEETFSIALPKMTYLFSYEHVFSHRIWKIRVYKVQLSQKVEGLTFVSKKELEKIAMPTALKKMKDFVLQIYETNGRCK